MFEVGDKVKVIGTEIVGDVVDVDYGTGLVTIADAYAETSDNELRYKEDELKIILRQILSQYLPRDITSLPKRGFGMPQTVFMNNAEMIHQMLNEAMESLRETRFFSEYTGLLQSIGHAAPSNINSAWAIIVLGQWVRSFPKRL